MLADSTSAPVSRSSLRLVLRTVIAAAILSLTFTWSPKPASADGDPASDVLVTQALFLPQDAGVSDRQHARLLSLLHAAQRSGYQLRVAVIASSADLGSVTELWRRPREYARFLGQELSLVYRGTLLVVMPGGFGVDGVGRPRRAELSALAGVTAPAAGMGLGNAAIAGIRRLAGASGHALALPGATAPSSFASADAVAWAVFAVGLALIGLAWTASLQAAPAHSRRRTRRP